MLLCTNSTTSLLAICFVPIALGCYPTNGHSLFASLSKSKVPTSANLVHSARHDAGIDASFGFVFAVEDEALLNQMIDECDLKAAKSESGFFALANYSWWPSNEEFASMGPSYLRTDNNQEEYWCVWSDPKSKKLYVEHGRW